MTAALEPQIARFKLFSTESILPKELKFIGKKISKPAQLPVENLYLSLS